ncbi:hypothetical protein [Mumia sp. ZJ430]|uniref:hypothetical protein n=1 Tax=Mumia sp. ZJ430 TaxID=2708083 RepID=UPI00141F2780|nr:hypothetical protein [Mumia sp. ZJ430]
MTSDGLFHIDARGDLVSMAVTPYEAEDVLQQLLESHPDLLAGGQMYPDAARRWALIKREYGVPDRDDAGDRWSIDHLFVDQDGVPTLVEVKRSTDTRIRREVVGQMLDYAANGVRYWPVDRLQFAFEETQRAGQHDPADVITALCGDPNASVEEFFGWVGDNLRGGRIRMIFVADVIPDELRRVTEFLNEQMNPAEVFAVEVKQYRALGYEGTVIVPAVYGRTAGASRKTDRRSAGSLEERLAASDDATRAVVERLRELAEHDEHFFLKTTPGGFHLRRSSDQVTVASVWIGYRALDVPVENARRAGRGDVDVMLESLQELTAKPLSPREPSIPSADALAHWDSIQMVIEALASGALQARP